MKRIIKGGLKFLFPHYRRLIEQYEILFRKYGQQKSTLESVVKEKETLLNQYIQEKQAHNRLREDFERLSIKYDELLNNHQENEQYKSKLQKNIEVAGGTILKLRTKLEEVQLERNEVYNQYNRLLDKLENPFDSKYDSGEPILSNPQVAVPIQEVRGLKLNVGCGNKKKPEYINVDLDSLVKPDIVLNVSSALPFKDDRFNAIEAYHVIEHIFPWLVLDVLREFFRILKPQGLLAIECPNIEAASTWLVGNSQYGWDSQMGMWPIYGDPNPKNSLYMHKWGYTPVTLLNILKDAGFRNIRREVPHTHIARRDFRLVAEKLS